MRAMFSTIAPRYDFVTRILSYGMDRRWKKLGVARATLPTNAMVLDLASGTGDFSKLVQEKLPQARSVAIDITEGMLQLPTRRASPKRPARTPTHYPSPTHRSTAFSSATACAISRI